MKRSLKILKQDNAPLIRAMMEAALAYGPLEATERQKAEEIGELNENLEKVRKIYDQRKKELRPRYDIHYRTAERLLVIALIPVVTAKLGRQWWHDNYLADTISDICDLKENRPLRSYLYGMGGWDQYGLATELIRRMRRAGKLEMKTETDYGASFDHTVETETFYRVRSAKK